MTSEAAPVADALLGGSDGSDPGGRRVGDVVPVAEGLFTWPVGPEPAAGSSVGIRLVGSACRGCGTATFPAQASCPRCTGADVEERPLATRGTLWTYTVQRFPPKEPYRGEVAGFRPFAVGYVELPDGVLVESRLVVDDVDEPDALRIGQEVALVAEPVFRDDEGRQVVTYAFAPGRARSSGGGA
jgi:uncharacterized OB-fold protein